MPRISVPPTTSRRCQGESYHPPVWNAISGRRVDGHTTPCRAGASAWLTEVDYCWGHIPAEWRLIAERRRQLWAELSPGLWNEICGMVPGPDPVRAFALRKEQQLLDQIRSPDA